MLIDFVHLSDYLRQVHSHPCPIVSVSQLFDMKNAKCRTNVKTMFSRIIVRYYRFM
jgi:hypothetical protein